jgi:hypothetical protein
MQKILKSKELKDSIIFSILASIILVLMYQFNIMVVAHN